MTRLRLDQLPADVRERVEAQYGQKPKRGKSRAGVGLSAPCPGHCGCGEAFPTAAKWERHAKATGCRVWRIDLNTTNQQGSTQ